MKIKIFLTKNRKYFRSTRSSGSKHLAKKKMCVCVLMSEPVGVCNTKLIYALTQNRYCCSEREREREKRERRERERERERGEDRTIKTSKRKEKIGERERR